MGLHFCLTKYLSCLFHFTCVSIVVMKLVHEPQPRSPEPFICGRESTESRIREILEACRMEVAVAIFESMEEEKTTEGITLSPLSLSRNRQG